MDDDLSVRGARRRTQRGETTDQQMVRSFSTAPRADAESLYYRPYRRVVGHGPPPPVGRGRGAVAPRARRPVCPGTTSLTHGRGRHPADRIGRRRPSLHAPWSRPGLACRRHVSGRRHSAITALLSRSTHAPVPARYGPHGRLQPRRPAPAPRGRRPAEFFRPTGATVRFFGDTLAAGSSIACVRTRCTDVQDPSRSQASRRWAREGGRQCGSCRYARLQTWGP